jgi:hypothetical protein
MLRSLKDIERYTVSATDGDVGSVVDFLLDDEHWAVRYLVAETGGFFDERRVLVSPIFLRQTDWSTQRLHVALTREKIKACPGIDTDKPVSRQYERDYYGYYGYPFYWGYPGLWGLGAYPGSLVAGAWDEAPSDRSSGAGDAHLRSAHEVRGYHVEGNDEAIGHIKDFIVDDATWQVRYLVVDTSNWWFGKNVLVAPHWASHVSWEQQKVHFDMSRQAIKSSPEWNAETPINREYEAHLYDYYGRPVYWGGDGPPTGTPPRLETRPGRHPVP